MLVSLRRSLALALVAAGAAVTTASCAENDSSIFIRGCVAVSRTDCTATVSTSSVLTLGGTIDALYAGQYACTLIVENQLVPRGDPTTLKTETSGVQLYDAEVQVLDPSTADANGNMSAITQFSVPITGFVDPGMAGTAGIGTTDVIMVDAATITAEGKKVASKGKVQTVVASVVVRGVTLGGLQVHSQEFLYPVQISAGGTCVEPMSGACVSTMTASSTTADCKLGVDEPAGTDCSVIAMTVGVCGTLECDIDPVTMKSTLTTARCPSHIPPDSSCCTP
jgi:hypothetical protein